MIDPRIGKARAHRLPVVRHRKRRERGSDFRGHQLLEELRKVRIRHGLSNKRVAARQAEVGEGAVARIEHMQFETTVVDHVRDDECTAVFPCGPRAGKAIFDDPLAIRLALHASQVFNAQGFIDPRSALIGSGGNDAVHHGLGIGHIVPHPRKHFRPAPFDKFGHRAA